MVDVGRNLCKYEELRCETLVESKFVSKDFTVAIYVHVSVTLYW